MKKSETESDFGKGVLHMNSVQAGKTMFGANYCDFPAAIKKVPIVRPYEIGDSQECFSHSLARH